ncbi:MAG: segregation/condensation protein A [Bacteroidetes bacterium]|nr:segregation/condensation protein A [Bacteroidota bacterium]
MEVDTNVNTEAAKEQENAVRNHEYWAKLPEFEGPLDILLHFIKADELDIYNIPISKITRDFLGYVNYMQSLDIEFAGEFLLMASELMKIKAKMLIPVLNEDGELVDEEDPRLTLIRKLLEYKRFKDATEELAMLEMEARKKFSRNYFDSDVRITETDVDVLNDPSLKNINIFNLIKAYKIVLSGLTKERTVHPIEVLDVSQEGQQEYVMNLLEEKGEVDFMEIIIALNDRLKLIFTFLALLQLGLDGLIEITVDPQNLTSFKLKKRLIPLEEL